MRAGKASKASSTEQALGRVVGALCAITAREDDAQSAMLASWISQVLPARHSFTNRSCVPCPVAAPEQDLSCSTSTPKMLHLLPERGGASHLSPCRKSEL
jgi:hypothetical protein